MEILELEESTNLLTGEDLNRASPELWPEVIPGVER